MLQTAMLYFEKSVLYSVRTRQYFCTVSHQSSRIGSALLLHQTFLNRGKATPHGPTNVYKLEWLRVLGSKGGILLLCSTWVTVTCCAVLRTFYFYLLHPYKWDTKILCFRLKCRERIPSSEGKHNVKKVNHKFITSRLGERVNFTKDSFSTFLSLIFFFFVFFSLFEKNLRKKKTTFHREH